MKKTLVTLLTIGFAIGAFAQGRINFANQATGVKALVYNVDPGNTFAQKQGQTSSGTPTGTQVYAGGPLIGTGFSAQLFAGALGTADADLQPVTPATVFRTQTSSAFAGTIIPNASLAIPGVDAGSQARIQLRAWDNKGGTVTTWADVLRDSSVARGWSLAFDSLALGTSVGAPPPPPPNLVGLTSFQLFQVPEPSVIALGVLGIGALLLIRRRK